jgi:hypothetical protein
MSDEQQGTWRDHAQELMQQWLDMHGPECSKEGITSEDLGLSSACSDKPSPAANDLFEQLTRLLKQMATLPGSDQRALVEAFRKQPELNGKYTVVPRWIIENLEVQEYVFRTTGIRLYQKSQKLKIGPKAKAKRTAKRCEEMHKSMAQGISAGKPLFQFMKDQFPELMQGCRTPRANSSNSPQLWQGP